MLENNTFSILTASRNCHQYLNDWSDSIISQSYRPLEVIFVNDCSKDKTSVTIPKIYRKLKSSGISLKVIENDSRQYCGSSYLKALKASSGYFVGVLDADDMLCRDSVSIIIDLYKRNPSIFWIYTQFDFCNENMKKSKIGFCKCPKAGESLLSLGLKDQHIFSHWRTFSKKIKNVESIFKSGLRSSVDKYMGYRLEELAPGGFFNKVLYKYRWRLNGSISKTEPAIRMWQKVKNEASDRRKKHNLRSIPIENISNGY